MTTLDRSIVAKLSCAILILIAFVYEIETEHFYRDIVKDVKKRFDTSGYSKDDNRPLHSREKEKGDRPDEI